MRIGIFGGSFNPVHGGHVRIACAALRELALDVLYVVPAAESPFKVGASGTSVPGGLDTVTRLRCVRVAFAGMPRVKVDRCELTRKGVSYAIDTVRHFKNRHPGAEVFFIVGEDSVAGLPRWKDWTELKTLATFKAYPRTRESSTEIRARRVAGLSVRGLVPPSVAEVLAALPPPCVCVPVELVGRVPKDFGLASSDVRRAAAFFAAASCTRLAATAKRVPVWHGVTVHLVRDAESAACHAAIMGVSGATDVITQAYDAIPPEAPGLWGELIVNVDQARRAAPRRCGWSVARELLLYVAHGMDHLSGADDHAPADYARMRRRELAWLGRWKKGGILT